ncbi:MAG: hypothetical protein ACRCTE_13775 [Cellulosilyticaceae bacterium]
MDIIIDNITVREQIKGFGQKTSNLDLVVNIKGLIGEQETRAFILSLQMTANGYTYQYSNLYTTTDIDNEGNIIIGQVTLIGEVDESTLQTKAQITFVVE